MEHVHSQSTGLSSLLKKKDGSVLASLSTISFVSMFFLAATFVVLTPGTPLASALGIYSTCA